MGPAGSCPGGSGSDVGHHVGSWALDEVAGQFPVTPGGRSRILNGQTVFGERPKPALRHNDSTLRHSACDFPCHVKLSMWGRLPGAAGLVLALPPLGYNLNGGSRNDWVLDGTCVPASIGAVRMTVENFSQPRRYGIFFERLWIWTETGVWFFSCCLPVSSWLLPAIKQLTPHRFPPPLVDHRRKSFQEKSMIIRTSSF